MQSLLAQVRLSARMVRPVPTFPRFVRSYAAQSYGNKESGIEGDNDAPNPKADLEHPGPEAPADKGTASSSSGSSEATSDKGDSSSGDSKPKIHQPGPPHESKNEDVKAHNEEMKTRSDITANQLQEEDQPVDKNYWQGDIGPKGEQPK